MNVGTITAKPDLQKITVRVVLPKFATWRMRVGAWVLLLGARIAGHGLKVEVYGEPT